jgi:thioredoxin reductase/NAD-dependent dihydropyrimidine dehydrogenase PreA subunit
MDQWPTMVGFVVLTALFVIQHVRQRPPAAARSRPCPRCRGSVPEGAAHCPGCDAPLQAFAVVTAPILVEGAVGAGVEGLLHAVVRADACAGCGTCVDACPEPGAIAMVNRIAKVNLAACKGHADCVAACPVGAIFVTSGEAVQTVEVPDLSEHFESRQVPGLYVVGELGGRGLIKNAINEGRLATEHVAACALSERTSATEHGVHEVLIVGSGPAGLSAGLEALSQGLRYTILEQGTLADSIARYPRHKVLFAEPIRVPLYGELWVSDASKESLLQVWQTVIDSTGLRVRTNCRVESVMRENGLFVVRAGELVFQARRVVLALGRRGTPRRLGVPGEELDKVFYDIAEMEAFAGRRVLVVGGGDSAIESAVGLAHQEGTTVSLSYRGAEFSRLKERNRAKIDAAVAAGEVELLLGSQVREVRRDEVVIEVAGGSRTLPNDDVIVRIGGEAPYPFIERCGVRIVKKSLAVEGDADARMAG